MSRSNIEDADFKKDDVNQACNTSPGNQDDSRSNALCDLSTSCGTKIQSSSGALPCTLEYPGIYDFKVELSETSSSRRSWVYSSKLGKVFVDINKILLFQIKLNTNCISNLRVRALLVYTSPDHNHLPVNRCMLHAFERDPNYLAHIQNNVCNCSISLAGHVLTSNHSEAAYEYNAASGRHSVSVPLEQPQVGSESILIGYQFGCKTSCEGGMSRRPVSLVFTLENEQDEVLGRSVMLVKVCRCPKRDKDREESDNSSINPECNNDRLRGIKRKFEDSQDDDLESESFDSPTPDSPYYGFLSLFNKIEKMSELMRQSVETQKKQIEDANRSTDEIMSAIEELTCKITDSSDQATNE
ncbi:hypothetical protein LSTR_LSTR002541 [Laodelphax striatellus]|uniref:p53 DNA-binding domain-containing protein n=1 Tax=Laodelphax striatellus TaxID=195883 RepID=A0A482XMX2_LAOST|nr:hypothetical protein LSTR_LSTR002541 [Laodelphax striatellus]